MHTLQMILFLVKCAFSLTSSFSDLTAEKNQFAQCIGDNTIGAICENNRLGNVYAKMVFSFLDFHDNRCIYSHGFSPSNPMSIAISAENEAIFHFLKSRNYASNALDPYFLYRPIDIAYNKILNHECGDEQIISNFCELMRNNKYSMETVREIPIELVETILFFVSNDYTKMKFEKLVVNDMVYDCSDTASSMQGKIQEILRRSSISLEVFLFSDEYRKQKEASQNTENRIAQNYLMISLTPSGENKFHAEVVGGGLYEKGYREFIDNDFIFDYGYWIIIGDHKIVSTYMRKFFDL